MPHAQALRQRKAGCEDGDCRYEQRGYSEAVPLEQAAEGYARMMECKARFRMVLTTDQ